MNDFTKGDLLKSKWRTVYSWDIGNEIARYAKKVNCNVMYVCEYSQIFHEINSKLRLTSIRNFCIALHEYDLRVIRKDEFSKI